MDDFRVFSGDGFVIPGEDALCQADFIFNIHQKFVVR